MIDSKKKIKETQKDMASSHRVATLLQTWIFFFLIYPDRRRTAAGIQLGLNFVWAAENPAEETEQMKKLIAVDAA